jgi:NDP-sugar pyrophosphorylase family protein
VVELSKDGQIIAFWKGSESREPFVNGGVYKLTPEIFKHIPENEVYDFAREVFPLMLKKNILLHGFVIHPEHAIFGGDTLETLELTRKYFNSQMH